MQPINLLNLKASGGTRHALSFQCIYCSYIGSYQITTRVHTRKIPLYKENQEHEWLTSPRSRFLTPTITVTGRDTGQAAICFAAVRGRVTASVNRTSELCRVLGGGDQYTNQDLQVSL